MLRHVHIGAVAALHLIVQTACARGGQSTPPVGSAASPSISIPSAPAGRAEGARVIASAREVRVLFPRDTAMHWGWAAPPGHSSLPYRWQLHVEGVARPHTLLLRVDPHPDSARIFRSLAALVAAGRASVCESHGMMATCRDTGITSTVVGGRVVLTLRDSTTIARMFGLRPATAGIFTLAPGRATDWQPESIAVEYIAPELPEPSAALHAAAERDRAAYRRSLRSIGRTIDRLDVELPVGPLWLAVGDTAWVAPLEWRCSYDLCSAPMSISDSGWVSSDSTTANVVAPDSIQRRRHFLFRRPSRLVIGVRPGRALIRVAGLNSPGDDGEFREPPPTSLEREVIVTRPVSSVELTSARDTVPVGTDLTVTIRVLDDRGVPIEEAPVLLKTSLGSTTIVKAGLTASTFVLNRAGSWRIIASLGVHSDTIVVHARER